MLQFPRQLNKLHIFCQGEKQFVVDLEQCRVFEVKGLICDILKRCASCGYEEIVQELSFHYSEDEILAAFEYLKMLEHQGFLFTQNIAPATDLSKDRPRYLCPDPTTFFADIKEAAGGHVIALHYLLGALSERYAEIHVCQPVFEPHTNSGIHGVPFQVGEPAFLARLINKTYQGFFMRSVEHTSWMHPLLSFCDIPIVVPLYSMRGHSGQLTNAVFMWYAAFRDYDAFLVPTQSVKDYYSRFLLDANCFHVSHYGVDHELFYPIDKQQAKRQVAEILDDKRILQKPIVGFLSRLQPEKGGGTYIQLARMIPEALFVAVAPTFMFYEDLPMPDNFIYAGAQPRERLPLFFNAFDMHCFPSVVEEETFGMVALEAMACGTPVVASNFDGIPEVIGDAGILVETETYRGEMGSIAGYVSAEAMAAAIRDLIVNSEKRLKLGEMAQKRSLQFTWNKAARDVMELFNELNRRRRYPKPQIPNTSIFFTPFLHESNGRVDVQSILAGVTADKRKLLMFESYIQSVEEGLALALLKNHTWHEVEAILHEFCGREGAKDIMDRVRQFLETLSI